MSRATADEAKVIAIELFDEMNRMVLANQLPEWPISVVDAGDIWSVVIGLPDESLGGDTTIFVDKKTGAVVRVEMEQ